MILISSITCDYFKSSILNHKNDLKWFYDTLAIGCSKNKFYVLIKEDVEIGLLINYCTVSNLDFGLCIYEKYRNQGYGTKVVVQLVQKFNHLVTFTINKHNINSHLFFNKLIKSGILNKENIKTN